MISENLYIWYLYIVGGYCWIFVSSPPISNGAYMLLRHIKANWIMYHAQGQMHYQVDFVAFVLHKQWKVYEITR